MLKVGEAECKASKGNMDLFVGTKLPERLPIVLADEVKKIPSDIASRFKNKLV